MVGVSRLRFGRLAYPDVPDTLGLFAVGGPQSNPNYPTAAGFYAEFDFDLPRGSQLWP
jgi:hypothetical protein